RIVSKIEELFTKLDVGIEELVQAKTRMKQYRNSLLHAAFSGSLTESWRRKHSVLRPMTETLEKISKERRRRYEKDLSSRGELKRKEKDYQFFEVRQNSRIPSWADARLENLVYIAGR